MSDSIAKIVLTKEGITKDPTLFADKKVLHLGCGISKYPGATGIDILPLPGVDVCHDLERTPWPFEESTFDVVLAFSVLEHVSAIVTVMNEVWRVAKPGAHVIIAVPYFRHTDAFGDPTHKIFFTSQSCDPFISAERVFSQYAYTQCGFKKVGFWYGWPHSKNILTRWAKSFFATHPRLYDQYLSLVVPVKILVWELEVVKQ